MSDVVYLLWFVQEREGFEDLELLIGVYDSEAAAKAAIDRVRDKPGFVDFSEGFQIARYQLGQDSWKEGFIRD